MEQWRGVHADVCTQVKHAMSEAFEKSARHHDRKVRDLILEIDDLVLVRYPHSAHSLQSRLRGPYRVIDTVDSESQQVYVVEDLLTGKTSRVHTMRLMPYDDTRANGLEDLKLVAASDGSEEFDVQKITGHKQDQHGHVYRSVKWLGFEEPTWETMTSDLLCTTKIQDYAERHHLL